MRAGALFAKLRSGFGDIALDDVIAEHDADLLTVGEVLGQRQRVGDSAFAFLVRVIDMFQTELFSVGQKPQKIARIAASGDNQNVPDARVDERLDRKIDHRTVVDRQQVFIGDLGEWEQATPGSAGEDDTLHAVSSYLRASKFAV